MVFDSMENLFRYEFISPYYKQIKDFLDQIDLNHFENKKLQLADKLSVICSSYYSGEKDVIETHDHVHDVVILLEGKELVNTSVRSAGPKVLAPYDKEKDTTYYSDISVLTQVHLQKGYFLIFGPDDVHQPYLIDGEKTFCKKVTFKIEL